MEIYESKLQEDGSTFPPVPRDVPQPPGVAIPEVADPFAEPAPDEQEEER